MSKQSDIVINDSELDLMMRLPEVRKIQESYPHMLIGGSIGLYLIGVKLSRFGKTVPDLDFISIGEFNVSDETIPEWLRDGTGKIPVDGKSGIDFIKKEIFPGLKIDLRFDPKHEVYLIDYNNHAYKVANPLAICAAKLIYAKKNTASANKHKQDMLEIIKGIS